MNTAQAPHVVVDASQPPEAMEVVVYEHTPLLYWWPVWVFGFVMAFLTWMQGEPVPINGEDQLVHPNMNLGVIYCLTVFLVVIMTNVILRGLVSGMVIIGLMFVAVLLAYFQLWDDILEWLGNIHIYMNMGFYVFLSTLVFIAWALSVFIFDRLNYWVFRPGQAEHFMFFGGGSRSYDTRGMSVYKLRDDLFRHWVLGLGSGDLHVSTSGAQQEEVVLYNVLFIGSKINKIQTVVAMKPDDVSDMVTTGHPE